MMRTVSNFELHFQITLMKTFKATFKVYHFQRSREVSFVSLNENSDFASDTSFHLVFHTETSVN